MNISLAVSLTLLLTAIGCPHHRVSSPATTGASRAAESPLDLTNASENEWRQHLGERVTMHGKFSLYGKLGAFIIVGGQPIYIKAKGSHSWGKKYQKMEQKEVRVMGTLRFVDYPEPPPGALPEGRAPDHFYFEAEKATIELMRR